MNQMQKQLPLKPSLANIAKSYCKRNNINEKQLLKAVNWYQSAISNSKKKR
tara:strand:- start:841 stop:993 length:153 start_codon:yes stop_codon:yes gene_type:complete